MEISEDINDEDTETTEETEQNENLNIETGSVYQNNRMNIIENFTAVDTRVTEMITNETVYIVERNVMERMKQYVRKIIIMNQYVPGAVL